MGIIIDGAEPCEAEDSDDDDKGVKTAWWVAHDEAGHERIVCGTMERTEGQAGSTLNTFAALGESDGEQEDE